MSWLTDLLQGIPINPVLREKLALAESRIKLTENENASLKADNDRLRIENKALKSQVEASALSLEDTEERGVLWKKRMNGSFHPQPYCPLCKLAMTKYSAYIIAGCEPDYKFRCQKCKFVSDVHEKEAPEIIASLS